MNRIRLLIAFFLGFPAALFLPLQAEAANRFSVTGGTGNWNSTTNWSTACGGAAGSAVPGAADTATICTGTSITVNVATTTQRVTINSGGTLNGGSATLTLTANNSSAVIPFTLVSGGTFNPGTGTIQITAVAGTVGTPVTLFAGTAALIPLNNLTLDPALGAADRFYNTGAVPLRINGNFDITPPSAGGVRTLTVTMGADITNTVTTGITTIAAAGNEIAILNTSGSNRALTTGKLVLGGGGGSGTLTANGSTITLNAGTSTLFTRNANGTFTAGTSKVVMNSAASVTLTAVSAGTLAFRDLTINMAGQTGTLGSTITVANNLAIDNGTLADGGFQITGNATGTLTAAAATGLTLGIAGTATTFPTLYTNANITLNPTSTVTYAAGVAQNVSTVPTYGNLTFSGASLKTTTPAGTLTIAGDWAIGGVGSSTDLTTNLTPVTMTGATKQISGLVGGITIPTLTVNGTVTNNATETVTVSTALSGSGTLTQGTNARLSINGTSGITSLAATASGNRVTYGGAAAQTVKPTTYHDLTINNGSGVTLGGDASVNNQLTFDLVTSGDLVTTSAFTLTMGAAAPAIAGAGTTQHVVGYLAKAFAATGSYNFAVGDGSVYAPVNITVTALTTPGTLTVTAPAPPTPADHPDTTSVTSSLNPARSVNRYWTIKKDAAFAGMFDAAFTYVNADVDNPGTANLMRFARGSVCAGSGSSRSCSTTWTHPTTVASPTDVLATTTGIILTTTAESDFAIGELGTTRFAREREFIFTRERY